MKLPARSKSSPLPSSTDAAAGKSPATIFWIFLHCLSCLISLILGFRFSRIIFFLFFSISHNPTTPFRTAGDLARTLSFTNSVKTNGSGGGSRVVVGRHGIRIRPWPHPDPIEVMKAHRMIEIVQREQRVLYGVKNPRTVIAITPTYVRTFQAGYLRGLMHTLMNLKCKVVWVVVEAGGATNETAEVLAKAKVEVRHVGFGKKMPVFWEARHKMEAQMRLQGLRIVREEQLDGIVMFADDSNIHSLDLFDEIQNVEWIGALSISILARSPRDNHPFEVPKNSDDKIEKHPPLPIQGPSCNSSGHLTGWHTFNALAYAQKSANYIGDMAVVLPRKLEWSGFVMNSRLVWREAEFKPDWIKDFETVFEGDGDVESPLSLLKDSSMLEPLGRCGKKVMLWWFRAEARADSKFPSGWTIDPPLDVTVPAKRTPWPEAFPEIPSDIENSITYRRSMRTRTSQSRRSP